MCVSEYVVKVFPTQFTWAIVPCTAYTEHFYCVEIQTLLFHVLLVVLCSTRSIMCVMCSFFPNYSIQCIFLSIMLNFPYRIPFFFGGEKKTYQKIVNDFWTCDQNFWVASHCIQSLPNVINVPVKCQLKPYLPLRLITQLNFSNTQ